ncbi:hypothetical protein QFC20_007426 [Naganishia adeliensis]|uniref:Uncharacterized protein n=1 Tax=Naganishia adeliensis TaxID=92952 RepID=A0ACC2V0V5_9TREE|nr:hypothetical protein QFC20_007426 [Naganishia adeliensis]
MASSVVPGSPSEHGSNTSDSDVCINPGTSESEDSDLPFQGHNSISNIADPSEKLLDAVDSLFIPLSHTNGTQNDGRLYQPSKGRKHVCDALAEAIRKSINGIGHRNPLDKLSPLEEDLSDHAFRHYNRTRYISTEKEDKSREGNVYRW